MTKYQRRVKVKCHLCKGESVATMRFGEDSKNPDDFELDCPKCDNWETGSLPAQSFDVGEEV